MSTDAQMGREALMRSSSNLKQILSSSILLVLAANLAFLILEIVIAIQIGRWPFFIYKKQFTFASKFKGNKEKTKKKARKRTEAPWPLLGLIGTTKELHDTIVCLL